VAISLDFGVLVAFLLALARSLAWLVVVPPFSSRQTIPPIATIATAVGLSLLVAPLIPSSQLPTDIASLIGSLVLQVLTGVAMGFLVSLLLSTFSAIGGFVEIMGGVNLPPSLNPLGIDQSSALGQFYEQVAIVLLFVSGGYLVMVDGFVRSFRAPALDLASTGLLVRVLLVDVATFFLSALEIAAPILAVLFATQIVLALLTKAAPQVNVWLLGMPLQIFLSLLLVAIGIAAVPGSLSSLVTRAVNDALGILSRH
jgi:flagellar biosynthetic protein FliR